MAKTKDTAAEPAASAPEQAAPVVPVEAQIKGAAISAVADFYRRLSDYLYSDGLKMALRQDEIAERLVALARKKEADNGGE